VEGRPKPPLIKTQSVGTGRVGNLFPTTSYSAVLYLFFNTILLQSPSGQVPPTPRWEGFIFKMEITIDIGQGTKYCKIHDEWWQEGEHCLKCEKELIGRCIEDER